MRFLSSVARELFWLARVACRGLLRPRGCFGPTMCDFDKKGAQLLSMQEEEFRPSTRKGKWKYKDVLQAAIGMAKNLPTPAQAMLFAEKFPACGSVIVMSDKNLGVPGSKDLSNNFHFVYPMTAMFPHKVPTAYFFADAFVALDDLLDGNLLKGTLDKNKDDAAAVREQKMVLAFQEGTKLKHILAYARYLSRGRNTASGNPRVQRVKELIKRPDEVGASVSLADGAANPEAWEASPADAWEASPADAGPDAWEASKDAWDASPADVWWEDSNDAWEASPSDAWPVAWEASKDAWEASPTNAWPGAWEASKDAWEASPADAWWEASNDAWEASPPDAGPDAWEASKDAWDASPADVWWEASNDAWEASPADAWWGASNDAWAASPSDAWPDAWEASHDASAAVEDLPADLPPLTFPDGTPTEDAWLPADALVANSPDAAAQASPADASEDEALLVLYGGAEI